MPVDLNTLLGQMPQGYNPTTGPAAGMMMLDRRNLQQQLQDIGTQQSTMDLDLQKLKLGQAHADENTFLPVERQEKQGNAQNVVDLNASGLPLAANKSKLNTEISTDQVLQGHNKNADRLNFLSELAQVHSLEYSSNLGQFQEHAKRLGMKLPDDYNTMARGLPHWSAVAQDELMKSAEMVKTMAPAIERSNAERDVAKTAAGAHVEGARLAGVASNYNADQSASARVMAAEERSRSAESTARMRLAFLVPQAVKDPEYTKGMDALDHDIRLLSKDPKVRAQVEADRNTLFQKVLQKYETNQQYMGGGAAPASDELPTKTKKEAAPAAPKLSQDQSDMVQRFMAAKGVDQATALRSLQAAGKL